MHQLTKINKTAIIACLSSRVWGHCDNSCGNQSFGLQCKFRWLGTISNATLAWNGLKIFQFASDTFLGRNFLNIYMKDRFCFVILNRTPAFQWICIREGPKPLNLPNLWDLNKKYYKPSTRTPRTHRYSTLSPTIV